MMNPPEVPDGDPSLTTHPRGDTRLSAVLALAGDESVTAAVVDAVARGGQAGNNEARGAVAARVWAGMRSAVDGIHGCRPGWSMLLFFVPLERGGEMEEALGAVLGRTATDDVELLCAIGELHGPAGAKLAALDSGLMEEFGSRRNFGSRPIHRRLVDGRPWP